MKNLLPFAFILIVPLVWTDKTDMTNFLKEIQTIKKCAPANSTDFLNVTYDNGVHVNMGKELTPTQVKNAPLIDWNSQEHHLYTLMMIYSDTPPFTPRTIHQQFNHWLLINIPGRDIHSADVISEYLSAGPPKGAGFYLYVFLLYAQAAKLPIEKQFIDKFTVEGRSNFSAIEFASEHKLGLPIAANYFKAQYDDYVPVVHAQIGM